MLSKDYGFCRSRVWINSGVLYDSVCEIVYKYDIFIEKLRIVVK